MAIVVPVHGQPFHLFSGSNRGTAEENGLLWRYDASMGELLSAAAQRGHFFDALPSLDTNSSSSGSTWLAYPVASPRLWDPIDDTFESW